MQLVTDTFDTDIQAAARRKLALPIAVLVVGVIASVLLFVVIRDNIEHEAQLSFERQSSDAKHVIEARIKSYFEVLYGLRALFAKPRPVSQAEFHDYVAALDPARRYPGFRAFNYAEYVRQENKATFEARVRRDTSLNPKGYPRFAIKPAGDRPEYFVLSYMSPLEGNEVTFGLDISANPMSKDTKAVGTALREARDSDTLASSGQLFKLDDRRHNSMLAIRLPVYRAGMPIETVEQRRTAYVGSVGTGFEVSKVMRGVLDESALRFIRFRVYEAGPARSYVANARPFTDDRLLFDSRDLVELSQPAGAADEAGAFKTTLPMDVATRVWEVQFTAPREAMVRGLDVALPWVTLGAGLLVSVLLFGMIHSLTTARFRAQHLAYHDGLTALPNRSFFSKLLAHSVSVARRYGGNLAVLFIDLDGFKRINDTLGHAAGDALLQEVASRLKACLRASDVVARLGGDEFIVLLEQLDGHKDVTLVAQKLLGVLVKPYVSLGEETTISASIGISVYPGGGEDERALIRNADTAMYRAKQAGKNNFQFHSPERKFDIPVAAG